MLEWPHRGRLLISKDEKQKTYGTYQRSPRAPSSSSSSSGADLSWIFTPERPLLQFWHRRSVNAVAFEAIFANSPIISFTRSSELYGEDGC